MKIILKILLHICEADLFLKFFTIYCISLYSFMLYYITTLRSVGAIKFFLAGITVGCILGEITGLSVVWYLNNVYYPSLEDSINSNDLISNTELVTQNTEPFISEEEKLIRKNTKNTLKWFTIGFFIIHIVWGIF
jgi:hypothetical protein